MSKPLKHSRTIACLRQSGRCYYCTLPMWSGSLSEFASKHGLTMGQAKELQCTGEHLTARQDGGDASTSNIVAACEFCNQHRHRRKNPLPPESYKKLVNARMSQGRWHYPWLRTETSDALGIPLADPLHANYPRAGDPGSKRDASTTSFNAPAGTDPWSARWYSRNIQLITSATLPLLSLRGSLFTGQTVCLAVLIACVSRGGPAHYMLLSLTIQKK